MIENFMRGDIILVRNLFQNKIKNINNDRKKNMKRDQGGNSMATQIAATPILYGKEAEKVLKEAKVKQSAKAKEKEVGLLKLFQFIK